MITDLISRSYYIQQNKTKQKLKQILVLTSDSTGQDLVSELLTGLILHGCGHLLDEPRCCGNAAFLSCLNGVKLSYFKIL